MNATTPEAAAALGARLGDYLAEWLDRQRPYLRTSTLHSYRIAVGRIVRRLGGTTLNSLTTTEVQDLQTDLLATGGRDGRPLAAKTVANTHVVLHKALADAVRLELLDHNVVAAVSPPRVPRPELSVWTVDQLRDFLSVASSHRLSAAFVLLATTGMRRGEVLGLRWSDIDFNDRSVSIVRTLTVVAGRPVVTTPKTTASRRLVYVDSSTVDALRDHRDESMVTRDGYVFQSTDGQPVNPASFSNTFDRLVARGGLPRIRLHDLRHTYATLALRLGTHPVLLSERLGHTSIAVTIDRYSHVIPSIDRKAADVVAQQILPQPD
ncbi:MAG: tyrosine-type recombinase/integrase [Ilumatobacteraceae bacterium]